MTAVSIITICRNDRAGLERTVESVLSQTLPPAELIIVDGASTDGTAEWLAATEWPSFVTWHSEPDGGIYDAMNRGIGRLHEHGLVMFLNAGDWLADPSILASVAQSYASHKWRWAAGSAMMVDATGEPLPDMTLHCPPRSLFMLGLAPVAHQATVFSAALLDEVGGYDPGSGIAADQQFIYRCWLASPPFALRTLVAYLDSSGVSSQVRPWFTTQQMRNHRLQLGRPLLGSRGADRVIAGVMVAIVATAHFVPARLRLRSLITTVRSALFASPD